MCVECKGHLLACHISPNASQHACDACHKTHPVPQLCSQHVGPVTLSCSSSRQQHVRSLFPLLLSPLHAVTPASLNRTHTHTHLVALAPLPVAEPCPAHDSSSAAEEEQKDAQSIIAVHATRVWLLARRQQAQLLHT